MTKLNNGWEDFNIMDVLRVKAYERIDEIEELKRKREIDLENLFDIDYRTVDVLTELDFDIKDRQEEVILMEIKPKKLKIPEKTTNANIDQFK